GAVVREFDLTQPAPKENFPGWEVSVGPLAMADVDGDGVLDLFVGGRVEPQRYPAATSSLLFRGTGNGFAVDPDNCRRLSLIGLVSGAVFSDLDGDGAPDLVLACDWGPLRLFHNTRGRLEPWDPPVQVVTPPAGARPGSSSSSSSPAPTKLSQLKGWW